MGLRVMPDTLAMTLEQAMPGRPACAYQNMKYSFQMSSALVLALTPEGMARGMATDVRGIESAVESVLNETGRAIKSSKRQDDARCMNIGKGKAAERMLVTDCQERTRLAIKLGGEQPLPVQFYLFAQVWENMHETGCQLAMPEKLAEWLAKFPPVAAKADDKA